MIELFSATMTRRVTNWVDASDLSDRPRLEQHLQELLLLQTRVSHTTCFVEVRDAVPLFET